MAKDINLQDVFLNQARKEHIPVTIYITNGFQFKGVVKGFDNYTVILDTEGKQNLIYKHAISTITPLKSISFIHSPYSFRKKADIEKVEVMYISDERVEC
jgi:host factor-I protein